MKILLELRPALDGFSGIPQETRLLFRGLRLIDSIEVEGLIQHGGKIITQGISNKKGFLQKELSHQDKINRLSRLVISFQEKSNTTPFDKIVKYISKIILIARLICMIHLGLGLRLGVFESALFKDFVWQSWFSKTLPVSDFDLVCKANFRVIKTPTSLLHQVGLQYRSLLGHAKYIYIDTSAFDIMISQTPFPGRVAKGTKLVIRYHDAIPILMPHTIKDKSIHQASHFYALQSNVKDGAYFACVSEASRQDLISIFPEVKEKTLVLHNIVSHHYFEEESPRNRVREIIRSRVYSGNEIDIKLFSSRQREILYRQNTVNLELSDFRYLLIVSSIEPRKNHLRLLSAWEILKAYVYPNLKLVIVGELGWNYVQTLSTFLPWMERGELFFLNAVPAYDLRVLYKHAEATVCPSLAEGFDFSGVEAMRSGGAVVASDITVHREIYENASEYFNPYSTEEAVNAIRLVIESGQEEYRQDLIRRGVEVSKRYMPDVILPKWKTFLNSLE